MSNSWSNISKPTLIVHRPKCLANIKSIAQKLEPQNISFRPHFKTHQSLEIGSWFKSTGVHKISVSSMEMALKFNEAGWTDISIVFPFNIREIDQIKKLKPQTQLTILIENPDTIQHFSAYNTIDLDVFIKIDCGYHRTGIDVGDIESVRKLAHTIQASPKLTFKGLLAHYGNTYQAQGKDAVQKIYSQSTEKLVNLRQSLADDFPNIMISVGDTPSVSLVEDYGEVNEFRPGNFIFYDWMQFEIGSCSLDQISAFMVCPVVAKYKERQEIVIHGGAVHFSKEKSAHYGAVCSISKEFQTQIIEGVYLKSLSQEHGIIHCTDAFFEETEIGDLITIIPIHSCLTANLMGNNTQIWG